MQTVQDKLRSLNVKEVSDVPFKDMWIYARLCDVTDGDTLKIIILMGEHPFKFSMRVVV